MAVLDYYCRHYDINGLYIAFRNLQHEHDLYSVKFTISTYLKLRMRNPHKLILTSKILCKSKYSAAGDVLNSPAAEKAFTTMISIVV